MNAIPIAIAASMALAPVRSTPVKQDTDKSGPIKLARVYKADDEEKYSVSMDDGGNHQISAKVSRKTLKVLDGGKATLELAVKELQMNGTAGELPASYKDDFDANGMPTVLDVQDQAKIPFTAIAICSYLPSQVESGKGFAVDWSSADKGFTVKGKGTYEGAKDVDGKKAIVIKTKLEVTPPGQSAATVTNTANFDKDTGKLISADATVEMEEGAITIKIKSM